MKKLIHVLVGLVFISISIQTTHAQKLYLTTGAGYSIGTNNNFYNLRADYHNIQLDSTHSYTKYELGKISMGQGLNVEFGLGTHIGEHFSIELTGFYFKSNKQILENAEHSLFYDKYELDIIQESILTGKMMGFKPCIVYWFGGNNIKPYTKLGAVVGFTSMTEEVDFRIFNELPGYYPTENYSSVFEFASNISIGACITGGFEIILAAGIRCFAELSYAAINYIPTSGEYTAYKYRGKDIMDELSASEIYYEYVDEFNTTENISENTPTKVLKAQYSYSKLSAVAGLKIHIIE
ncbi:MAG: hypothetical protein ABFS05_06385 [Bacteroidota bacterium]